MVRKLTPISEGIERHCPQCNLPLTGQPHNCPAIQAKAMRDALEHEVGELNQNVGQVGIGPPPVPEPLALRIENHFLRKQLVTTEARLAAIQFNQELVSIESDLRAINPEYGSLYGYDPSTRKFVSKIIAHVKPPMA